MSGTLAANSGLTAAQLCAGSRTNVSDQSNNKATGSEIPAVSMTKGSFAICTRTALWPNFFFIKQVILLKNFNFISKRETSADPGNGSD